MHTALFTLFNLVIASCRFVHFSKVECTLCGTGIQKIARHCPDPALIGAYLRETCQVVKDVTETSPVCSRCYFSNLRIAKVKSNSDMMSTNDGIKQLRKELLGKEEFLVGNDIDTIVEKVLLQIGVWVLDALLENMGLLLVDARDHFCSVCSFLSTQSKYPIRTANWLLISLYHLLYPHFKQTDIFQESRTPFFCAMVVIH